MTAPLFHYKFQPGEIDANNVLTNYGTLQSSETSETSETLITSETGILFNRVASNLDGTILIATTRNGKFYRSVNAGVNWIQLRNLFSIVFNSNIPIASSSDGTKLVFVVNNGNLYTSTNSGANWTVQVDDMSRFWSDVASSYDGNKLVAVVYGGQIYTSTNSGVSWTARALDSNRYWVSVASSSDGTKLVAVVYGGQIYTSTDSGVSWTAQDIARNWNAVASSTDGTKLVAVVYDGQIYTSVDSGVTWTARDIARNWNNVSSSVDGVNLLASVDGGDVYSSSNSGLTWTARGAVGNWKKVLLGNIAFASNGTIAKRNFTNNLTIVTSSVFGLPSINTSKHFFGSGCLYLNNAQSQYIQTPSFTSDTNGITIVGWFIAYDNTPDNSTVFDFANNTLAVGENILFYPKSAFTVNRGSNSTSFSTNVADSNWHLFVWTMTQTDAVNFKGTWNIYIDGIRVYNNTAAFYPSPTLRNQMFLGKSNLFADTFLNGYLNEFRYYNRVLSDAEISDLFYPKVGRFLVNNQNIFNLWERHIDYVKNSSETALRLGFTVGDEKKDLANIYVLKTSLAAAGKSGISVQSGNFVNNNIDTSTLFVNKGTIF